MNSFLFIFFSSYGKELIYCSKSLQKNGKIICLRNLFSKVELDLHIDKVEFVIVLKWHAIANKLNKNCECGRILTKSQLRCT